MDAEHLILCSFLFQFYCNSPTSNTGEVSKILVCSGKNIETKNKKSQNSKYQTHQTHMDPSMDSHGKLVYLPYIYLKCMVFHVGTSTIFPMGSSVKNGFPKRWGKSSTTEARIGNKQPRDPSARHQGLHLGVSELREFEGG